MFTASLGKQFWKLRSLVLSLFLVVKQSEERRSDTRYEDAGIIYNVRNNFLKDLTLISKAKLIISNGVN